MIYGPRRAVVPDTLPDWIRTDALYVLRGDAVELSAGRVHRAIDQSIHGNDWFEVGSGGPTAIASAINSKPGWGAGVLNCSTLPLGGPSTLFIVLRLNADPPLFQATSGLITGGISGFPTHYPYTDGTIYSDWASDTRHVFMNPTSPLTSAHLLSMRVDPVVSGDNAWGIQINNGPETLITSSVTDTPQAMIQFPSTRSLGVSQPGSLNFDGVICEVIEFGRRITGAERTAVHRYLRRRFHSLPI